MVHTIDHAERRALLAEAVWAVIGRDGFEAASVRAVAAEADLSAGSVRHFFASQDELHVFAMEELERRVGERVAAVWRPAEATIDSALAALIETLPLTPETESAYGAHLQFVTRSTVHPGLQPVARRTMQELQDLYRQLVGALVATGAARPDLDVDDAVDRLAALLDGVVLRRLVVPELLSAARARELVADFLTELGPGRGDAS